MASKKAFSETLDDQGPEPKPKDHDTDRFADQILWVAAEIRADTV